VAFQIDPATGMLAVDRVVAVDDVGRVVNPLLAEGQVVGSTAQGVGQAIHEEMVHDDDGQPLTGNLTLYGIPGASEVPRIHSEFLETPSPFNPAGGERGRRERLHRAARGAGGCRRGRTSSSWDLSPGSAIHAGKALARDAGGAAVWGQRCLAALTSSSSTGAGTG
jgi:Molybdopterin-binding domain of aldehyde dehydrogenase